MIAAAALLSPVLAFLLAIAVEMVIVVLQDAGVLKFVALVAVGAVGWSMLRKLWVPVVRYDRKASERSLDLLRWKGEPARTLAAGNRLLGVTG